MKKYYLLTFNEDYADEHDVPALACFTEEQYNAWLEKPSGKLNPNYDKELQNFKNYTEAKNNLHKKLGEVIGDNWGNTRFTEWPDYPNGIFKEYDELPKSFGYKKSYPEAPQKNKNSLLRAHLGNGGDGFEENYKHLNLFKEFVEAGVVTVLEVDESFYNYFHKANLSNLSLCNIFDGDIEDYYDDEDDEEDEDF